MSPDKPFDLFEPELRSPHDRILQQVAARLIETPHFAFALVIGVTPGRRQADGALQVDILATASERIQHPELLRAIATSIRETTVPQIEARAAALEREREWPKGPGG